MVVSLLQKTEEDDSAKQSCQVISVNDDEMETAGHTCVATYAMEAMVAQVIPCKRALPDFVAFVSFSTELGKVKMCLYACPENKMHDHKATYPN